MDEGRSAPVMRVLHSQLNMADLPSLKLLQPLIMIVPKLTMMAMIYNINQYSEAAMEVVMERTPGRAKHMDGYCLFVWGGKLNDETKKREEIINWP